ncbi:hypothetical protein ACXR8U_31935 (plasmid) [Methylobacterium radiotolerans]|jgi:hypothetical protein|uniref:hypothetical protein n=1 Tax=Methylobacterium TaxID=407 RepID=UPI0005E0976F|nr:MULTISPECIES: hypothetical protein [Methylobacterium]MBN6819397.1 hypothetical protein [Methylobacterium organophilum]OXE38929.1 hypothetical protein CCS92_26790 [Methylobacterium radiotolerans]GAN48194.1 hypothetical protein ME121_2209 [Methylobacterium sp. ME121]
MADAAAIRETIRLDEGDVIVLLPGNLSPTSIGLLQAKLDGLAADLNARCLEDSRASLSGLAGLAAVLAN